MRMPVGMSMPRSDMRCGIGQKGLHSVSCTSTTKHIVPTVSTCIICHERWKATTAATHALPVMAVSSTMCSTGKKTPKSRGGVIHSWMLLMHSNVPCIFAIPAMKQTGRRIAILVVLIVMTLQTPITAAAPQSSCWLVKRNFMRNSIGNQTAIPANPV